MTRSSEVNQFETDVLDEMNKVNWTPIRPHHRISLLVQMGVSGHYYSIDNRFRDMTGK